MEYKDFLKQVYDLRNKSKKINMKKVYEKVGQGMPADISDRELVEYMAETIASMTPQHPDYGLLAGQVCVTYLHQTTSNSVLDYANKVFANRDHATSENFPLISQETLDTIKANAQYFDGMMDYGMDFTYDYFAFKTLEKSYLLKDSRGIALERPQNMLLRVAVGIHGSDTVNIAETYKMMSTKQLTHASPTLFNAGTVSPQMSSCFLMHMKDDSLQGIFDTLNEASQISKSGSGLAIHIHNIRSKGSVIKGNNGRSAGIVPMLRVFNETARYVDQAGKRKGAFAIYLEPWHADIVDFLDLRKNHGKEEMRARDLFYGLWVPDLFMERVEADGDWTLFDPKTVPTLPDAYGDTFKDLYERYEIQVKGTKMKARDLWQKILEAQIETGNPYMLYKDAANLKSNQKNIGTIKSSNLCFSGDTIVAVADGRNGVRIDELAKESDGTVNFPVYSARPRKGGKVGWVAEIKNAVAFKSGTKEVIEVVLDDGTSFRCTEDHQIALRDGGYKEAGKLGEGESLAHFFSYTETEGKSPYRHINSRTNGHSKQHRMLWEYHNGPAAPGCHVDHILNNGDDSISNLQLLAREEHFAKTAIERQGVNNPMHRIRDKEAWRAKQSVLNTREGNGRWSGLSDEDLIEYGRTVLDAFGYLNGTVWAKYREETGVKLPLSFSKNRFQGKWSVFKTMVEGNHKVKEIRRNKEVVDVYDLTVEDNHNFYILTSGDEKFLNSSGVLVHNCCEILEVSKPDETAVCNLSSISLPAMVENGEFDFYKLVEVTRQAIINMNRVIDRNFYPTPSTKKSNIQHRPVGLGVQGLADVFMILNIPFESEQAKDLNKKIFETMYFAALQMSNKLAQMHGPYATFPGSPASQGILQFDMWGVEPSRYWDWDTLRADIKTYGLRNSLLIALMPTATTGQILGNNECFEPYTSNIYARRVLSGEFVIVNKHLVRKLEELGLWSDKMRNKIIANNGSVQGIKEIPKDIQEVYKTVWEISQKTVIDLAADRGAFVDQSQSMNIFMAEPNFAKLTSMHMYAWKKGLKTGMYYLRTLPKSQAVKFTVEKTDAENKSDMVCSLSDPESCEACGS